MDKNQHQSRHSKGERKAGEKVGGRFKKSQSTEASGSGLIQARSLSAEDVSKLTPAERRQHREALARENYASLTPAERRARNEEYRELASQVRKMHNHSWTHHDHVLANREDIRQEAMIRFFVKGDGEGLENIATEHLGLARTMLSQEVTKVMNNGQSSREANGRQRLFQLRREIENERGRSLTSVEFRDLAEEVRMSFDPGKRPKAGYQNEPHPEMNLAFNEDEPAEGEPDMRRHIAFTQKYSIDADDTGADDAFLRAQERLDSKQEKRNDLRDNIWSVMRESNPALPELSKPPISAAQARRLLASVPDGAYGAADRFLNGRSTPKDEAAMFAPWGGPQALSASQQTAVAEKLGSSARFSDRVWDAALSASSRQAHAERPAPDEIGEF